MLYALVKEHLGSFLQYARESYAGPLPSYVVEEFRSYLGCSSLNVLFHLLCLDGVYVDDGETLRFEPAPAPTRAELTTLLQRVHARVMKWLVRRRLVRSEDDIHASNALPEVSPAEALAAEGMQRGTLVNVREPCDASTDDDPALSPPPRVTDAVTHERFNLHASADLAASDDLGRERLCRYLTPPAFSLARLGMRRDGTVAYFAHCDHTNRRTRSPVSRHGDRSEATFSLWGSWR